MTFIRLISDIHLDTDLTAQRSGAVDDMNMLWQPPGLDGDERSVLVIAGDLWVDSKFLTRKYKDGTSWMQRVAPRFRHVVFVLGNHDYWGTNLSYEPENVRLLLAEQGIENATLLDDTVFSIDHVKFVGGTLWTDLNKCDPIVEMNAPGVMNDYRKIRADSTYRKIRPSDLYMRHAKTRKFLFENTKRDFPEQKVVVVTHMAPSEFSISIENKMRASQIEANYHYFSDLTGGIFESDIDVWMHGHVHTCFDYELDRRDGGHCRVITNPRGYSWEDVGCDESFRFEV